MKGNKNICGGETLPHTEELDAIGYWDSRDFDNMYNPFASFKSKLTDERLFEIALIADQWYYASGSDTSLALHTAPRDSKKHFDEDALETGALADASPFNWDELPRVLIKAVTLHRLGVTQKGE